MSLVDIGASLDVGVLNVGLGPGELGKLCHVDALAASELLGDLVQLCGKVGFGLRCRVNLKKVENLVRIPETFILKTVSKWSCKAATDFGGKGIDLSDMG